MRPLRFSEPRPPFGRRAGTPGRQRYENSAATRAAALSHPAKPPLRPFTNQDLRIVIRERDSLLGILEIKRHTLPAIRSFIFKMNIDRGRKPQFHLFSRFHADRPTSASTRRTLGQSHNTRKEQLLHRSFIDHQSIDSLPFIQLLIPPICSAPYARRQTPLVINYTYIPRLRGKQHTINRNNSAPPKKFDKGFYRKPAPAKQHP